MDCPQCGHANPSEAKFCMECGQRLELSCPDCGTKLPQGAKFCPTCGRKLEPPSPGPEQAPKIGPEDHQPPSSDTPGERKYVTVLFSDISGYTAMSERLDPEELKEITGRLFGQISRIVSRYEGFVEKFIGDAVMILFGVPQAHEDDPLRALRAAREIHRLASALSPEVEDRIGQPLAMHSGVSTGLVVTGEVNLERGTHGVAGETLNLAARLSGLAQAGQIIADPQTSGRARDIFSFLPLEPVEVKGRSRPVQAFLVEGTREQPGRPASGLTSDLIGRQAEMDLLKESLANLGHGQGLVVTICGEAGTGKTRLLQELKSALDPEAVTWIDGQAYTYATNTPYYPLIDMLNRTLGINEGDSPDRIRAKLEAGLAGLVPEGRNLAPYLGGLYSLDHPEIDQVSPQFWQSRLQEAVKEMIIGLAREKPTVICLEDLQWADPSSIDLLRAVLPDVDIPVLILAAYRPPFSLFGGPHLDDGSVHRHIQLKELSPSETQDLIKALLKTENPPPELIKLVRKKVEGNPYFLKELIGGLIDSGALAREGGEWRLTRRLAELELPSTIRGVISARLDRLGKEPKRVLQEASVIGRVFQHAILNRCTETRDHLDDHLNGLERYNFIRTTAYQPYLEYAFNQALTQEVAYKRLLKKDRRVIHERIALTMEEMFKDRKTEFCETLAFHFSRGQSREKAVKYLLLAGEKGLKRYAVEEAHQYYAQAYELLVQGTGGDGSLEPVLIKLLIDWAMVFYYRGEFRGLVDLFSKHERTAGSLDNPNLKGMFYAWLGFGQDCRGRSDEGHRNLIKALEIGQEAGDENLLGHAYAWLSFVCVDKGRLEEAMGYARQGLEIARRLPEEPYLFFKSMGGLGYASFFLGQAEQGLQAGEEMVQYGRKRANIRSTSLGRWILALNNLGRGRFDLAEEQARLGVKASADPYYRQICNLVLGSSLVLDDRYEEAEVPLQEVVHYSDQLGSERVGEPARIYLGAVTILKGRMNQGLELIEKAAQSCQENGRLLWLSMAEMALGRVFAMISARSTPISLMTMAKNLTFLAKNVPQAGRRAEDHLKRAIDLAKGMGSSYIASMVSFDLGLYYLNLKRLESAREYLALAADGFREIGADTLLDQARAKLAGLEKKAG